MKTSEQGRSLIEAFEGLALKSYRDSVGVLTIGYGHTSAAGGPRVVAGQRITSEEADRLLADDLSRVEKNITQCIKVPLAQYEFDALVSFDFNTGSLKRGSIDDKINARNKQAAMDTLLQYNHAGGRVLAGLTRRRNAEKLMFEGKVQESLKLAGAKAPATPVVIIATGTAAAVAFPAYIPYIVGAVAAIGVGYLIYKILKGKKNVSINQTRSVQNLG